jgi:hypothetical protein
MGFCPNSEWENFSQIEKNGRLIPKPKMLVGFFSPCGKNKPIGFFPCGIFHGTANRSEKPTKIPRGFMF